MAWWLRSVLYQCTHSKVAASTWSRSRQGPSALEGSTSRRPGSVPNCAWLRVVQRRSA